MILNALLGLLLATTFEPRVGYRQDHLTWTIGIPRVDILSELTWDELDIVEMGGYCSTRWQSLIFEGETSFGPIVHGWDQDSDFAEPGRQEEFSRSYSRAGGYVFDLLGSVGWKCCPVVPKVGLSTHTQRIRSYDGRNVFDGEFAFPISGTHSTYTANWLSAFCGLSLMTRYCEVSGRAHVAAYRGVGDWMLREFDYFIHTARAYGFEAFAKGTCPVWRGLSVTGTVTGRHWWSKSGAGRTYWDHQIVARTRFNGAHWHSFSVAIGVVIR